MLNAVARWMLQREFSRFPLDDRRVDELLTVLGGRTAKGLSTFAKIVDSGFLGDLKADNVTENLSALPRRLVHAGDYFERATLPMLHHALPHGDMHHFNPIVMRELAKINYLNFCGVNSTSLWDKNRVEVVEFAALPAAVRGRRPGD
jgi:hypothetical protein